MQYQDIPPAQIKENALRALSAGFSDEFMERLAEQEGRMRLKEIFAGRRDFHGGDICNYLKDGSYYFPFIIYREQIKNHNNLSMANRGFENPCELIVKDHEGLVYLAVKTVSAESMSSGKKMEGRVNKMQYLYDGEFRDGGIDGRYVYFPVTALNFIAMGKGRDTLLHGSVCLKMQCSVGDMHMPESTASFHHVHPLKRGCQGANENFLDQVWYKSALARHDAGLRRFFEAQKSCLARIWYRNSIDREKGGPLY